MCVYLLYMGARQGESDGSKVFLTACVVAGFIAVALTSGTGPAYATHCHDDGGGGGWSTESDCQHDDYDDDENRICEDGDTGFVTDTDGDGEMDCFDNDNDGDWLTDKKEDQEAIYNRDLWDTDGGSTGDGDGIPDAWDVAPTGADLPLAQPDVPWYDLSDDGTCDGSFSEPGDPWVYHFRVWLGHKKSDGTLSKENPTPLAPPSGWTKDNHGHSHPTGREKTGWTPEENEGTSGIGSVDDGDYTLPSNVTGYGVTDDDDQPSIGIEVAMRDHDGHEGGGEEDMDHWNGPQLKAKWDYQLADGGIDTSWTSPDAECNAAFKASFEDPINVDALAVSTYHADHPQTMIYSDTV